MTNLDIVSHIKTVYLNLSVYVLGGGGGGGYIPTLLPIFIFEIFESFEVRAEIITSEI